MGIGVALKTFMSKFFMLWVRQCQASYAVRDRSCFFTVIKNKVSLNLVEIGAVAMYKNRIKEVSAKSERVFF